MTENSRTRPGRQPDPNVLALRALRNATDDYLIVLEAGYVALTDQAIAGKPNLAYLRSALAVAAGKRGSGAFGTPLGIRNMLTQALGESETT